MRGRPPTATALPPRVVEIPGSVLPAIRGAFTGLARAVEIRGNRLLGISIGIAGCPVGIARRPTGMTRLDVVPAIDGNALPVDY